MTDYTKLTELAKAAKKNKDDVVVPPTVILEILEALDAQEGGIEALQAKLAAAKAETEIADSKYAFDLLKLETGAVIAERDSLRQQLITTLWQQIEAEPVAWRYDLARNYEQDLRGRQWQYDQYSRQKPVGIDHMIKNLTPLYLAAGEELEAAKAALHKETHRADSWETTATTLKHMKNALQSKLDALEKQEPDIYVHHDGIAVWGAKANPEFGSDPLYTAYYLAAGSAQKENT